ncbi:MAG: hypothetical protein ABIB61_04640 [Candidatus Shapirobacteria bacterium]
MKKIIGRYWLLVFLACLATILLVARSSKQKLPVITSIDPPSGQLVDLDQNIKIGLSDASGLKASDFNLKTAPSFDNSLSVQDGFLLIEVKGELIPQENYFLELNFQNQPIYSWTYYFNPPQAAPAPVLGQGEPGIRQEILDQTLGDYPLILKIPYETEDFSLGYVSPLILGVKIKKGTKEGVWQEVADWIESQGLPADSHEIVWLE